MPIHLCNSPASRCKARTPYHSVTHVAVFRLLDDDAYKKLRWMTANKTACFQATLDGLAIKEPQEHPLTRVCVVSLSSSRLQLLD